MSLEINQEPWYFSVGEDHMRLDTLPQKQCYAYRSIAATLRALQRREQAEDYQQKRCGLDRDDERLIQDWVDVEIWHMGAPQRSSRR